MKHGSNGFAEDQPLALTVLPRDPPSPVPAISDSSSPKHALGIDLAPKMTRPAHIVSLDDAIAEPPGSPGCKRAQVKELTGVLSRRVKQVRRLTLDDETCNETSKGSVLKEQRSTFQKVLSEQLGSLERVLVAAHLEDCTARGASWTRTETTKDVLTPPISEPAERNISSWSLPSYPSENASLEDSRSDDGKTDDGKSVKSFKTSFSVVSVDSTYKLRLKSMWKEPERTHLQLETPSHRQLDRAISGMLKRSVTTQLLTAGMPDEFEDVRRSDSFCSRFIMHPTSMKRFFWDVLGVLIMLYDTVIIPMQVFDLPASSMTSYMGKASLGYWTLDIGLSFMVGYYNRGILEMRPYHIAAHYATTWLPFDIIIIGLDWSVQIATDGETESVGAKSKQVTRIGRALRTLRTLRSLRLLRLIKMRHLLNEIQERFSSEYVHIILRMAKLIIAIALLNHFIACGWWAIGKNGGQSSWIVKAQADEDRVGYQYTTSLHWSLTQFTPASMEVVPTNTAERTYAVCTLLFAMVIFSSFVSSITATMTILRELSGKQGKTKQFKVLKFYLRDNDISKILQIRIQKYLQHVVLRAKSHVPEKDVELLSLLSQPLRMELRYTIIWPVFRAHPFFSRFEQTSIQATRQLCMKSIEEIPMSVGDTIFSNGEASHGMYFIVSGQCLYQLAQRGGLRSNADDNEICKVGKWLAELALWCNWVHKGELLSTVQGRCMRMKEEPFANVVASHQMVIGSTRRYASALLIEIVKQKTPLSDLPDDQIEFQEIASECFPLPEVNKEKSGRRSRGNTEELEVDWDRWQAGLSGMERSIGRQQT